MANEITSTDLTVENVIWKLLFYVGGFELSQVAGAQINKAINNS